MLDSIRHKISKFKDYSHTYELDLPACPFRLQNNYLSVIEKDKRHHYVHFLSYDILHNELGEQIQYREIALKLDRWYYLEIVNGIISDEERLKNFFFVLGERQFGYLGVKRGAYLLDVKDRAWIDKDDAFLEPNVKDFSDDIVFYGKEGKHKNSYEIHSFHRHQHYYILLIQINRSSSRTSRREFVVEFDKEEFDELTQVSSVQKKVEQIYVQMGRIYFRSLESTTEQLIDIDKDQILEYVKDHDYGGVGDEDYRRFNQIDATLLKQDTKELHKIYFKLYRFCQVYRDNPDEGEVATVIASLLQAMLVIIQKDAMFNELVMYLASFSVLIEDDDFSTKIKENRNFSGMFIQVIENIGDWIKDITWDQHLSTEDKVASTVDMLAFCKHILTLLEAEFEQQGKDSLKSDTVEHPVHYISSEKLFEELKLDQEFLEEIEELDENIKDVLDSHTHLTDYSFKHLYEFFHSYSTLLNSIYDFKDLGYAVSSQVNLMKKTNLPDHTEEQLNMIYILLKSLVTDLVFWKEQVIVQKSAENIHYMDKSFYSNIQQLEIMLLHDGDDEGDEIEFF